MLAYIYWNAQPDLLHLGPLTVRWYGLMFGLLFWIGYLIGQWIWRTEGKGTKHLDQLLIYIVVGTIVGARLGHCFFYDPGYYLAHPLEILKVWHGGLASHGGAVGVMLAVYLFARLYPDQPFTWLLDRIVVPTALGGALIRTGNLFNSEILGRPTDVPWAFVFARVDNIPRHPVQLYEAIAYALIFVLLLSIYRRLRARTPQGLLVGLFFLSVFSARFALEFLKERMAVYEQSFPLSVGQLLSVPFILLGLLLVVRALRTVPDQNQTGST